MNDAKEAEDQDDEEQVEIFAKRSRVDDFEDVLREIGGWGRYQFVQLMIFFGITFIVAYVAYSPILFLYTPDHRCRDDPAAADRCSCRGWDYNVTGLFTTVITQNDWVCDDAWKGPFTQSVFSVGGVFGTVIFGFSADRFGRFRTFFAANVLLLLSGLATPYFSHSFASFLAARFVLGLTSMTFFSVFYLLTLEYVDAAKRSLVGNLSLAVGITFGCLYQPWLIRATGDWKLFHHILYLQLCFIFVTPFCVKESVRWLATKGRVDEALEVLDAVAGTNGRRLDEAFKADFKVMVEKRKVNVVETGLADVFRSRRLLRNFIILNVTWLLIAGVFDGLLGTLITGYNAH